MIIITTKMRVMPETCSKCSYYLSKNRTFGDHSECLAVVGHAGFKTMDVKPTKGRQIWCPLLQTYQNKQVIDCRKEGNDHDRAGNVPSYQP